MTVSPLKKPSVSIRWMMALVGASAAVILGGLSAAIAQQSMAPTLAVSAGGASTTTNPQIAPSTPQIAFASPTLKAPRYGKS